VVERPALAGQAPQLKQRSPVIAYPTAPETRTLPNPSVLIRMGAYGMDRIAVGGMVDVLPGMPGHVYADKQLVVLRTTSPNGLSFVGEIDASNSHAVSEALTSAQVPDQDIHVEVGGLIFCDISGIRALVTAAEGLPKGRRMLLHGMPAQLETVIKAVGWNRIPALVVCKCESD
jgi:anti-anti-sigma regulatory factor